MTECLFDKEKKCPILSRYPSLDPHTLSRFCQACAQVASTKITELQLDILEEQLLISKASTILSILSMFPGDESKMKEVYQKVLEYAKELK